MKQSFTYAGKAALKCALALGLLVSGGVLGQEPRAPIADTTVPASRSGSNGLDVKDIEKIVHDYLLKNPSVIREAMQALDAQDRREQEQRVAAAIKENSSALFADPDSPIAGNAAGDVSVVVFLDYSCGFCRSTLPHLQTIADSDQGVRIVFKEFPILGSQSHHAAIAALAAARQGKYLEFHNSLLTSDSIGDDGIKAISTELGLDYARLQRDMADPEIEKELNRNLRLGDALSINGTPAYIIGDQLVPGALDLESLQRFIAIARSKSGQMPKEANTLEGMKK